MWEMLAIIKGMAWVSSGVATFHFFLNTKLFDKVGLRLQKIKSIKFNNEHTTVFGITRHGKTYAIIKSLEKHSGAVFFYNVNDEKVKGFIKADSTNSPMQIVEALKRGKKINFIPTGNLEKDSKIFGALVNYIFDNGVHTLNSIWAIDEVHLFNSTKDKSGIRACQRIATTGLRRGMNGIWITQRGALIDNTLFTQSTRVILFALGHADISYLKGHGVPTEQITEMTKQEKYRFADYDLKAVKGPYMIVD